MHRLKNIISLTILLVLNFGLAAGQGTIDLDNFELRSLREDISHYHFSGSKPFSDPQNIHIISLPLESLKSEFKLDVIDSFTEYFNEIKSFCENYLFSQTIKDYYSLKALITESLPFVK